MSVAKVIEISAQSPTSFEDAIAQGIRRSSETVKQIQSAWVKELKVDVKDGKVSMYRVILKVTFVLQG
jgi:dodecin